MTSISQMIIFLGLHTAVNSQQFEFSESMCQRPWTERVLWSRLSPVQPDSEAFREQVLMGKPARVVLQQGNYRESCLLDNINMNGNVICGEATQRMSSPIGANAEFQPILVCTNGHVDYLNCSATRRDGNVVDNQWIVDAISFRTRDYSPDDAPVSSRYLDGSSSMQSVENYMTMARKSEMRGVMRDRAYAFSMDNVHLDFSSGHISGQSLSHVSQSYTPTGGITFRSNPYHWFSSWETTGRRDSARWTVGELKPFKHTNDYVALQWFADACWTIVYRHDQTGQRLAGSLAMLKNHIQMGHRVRMHFDGYTLEATSVIISQDGGVMAQTSAEMARRGGSGPDKIFFNTKTRQMYRLVHTSGEVRSYFFFIENGLPSERTSNQFTITWSVDTRPWNPVLVSDSQNQITFGTARDLAYIMDFASTRVKLDIKAPGSDFKDQSLEMYLEVNSVRTPKIDVTEPEIIGQSLRTAPVYLSKDGKSFALDLFRPQKQYIEISTAKGVAVHRFNMNSLDYTGQAVWKVRSITWFQDGRLYQ